jgi:hypothetical protein
MKIIESASQKQGSEIFYKFQSGHTAIWSKTGIMCYLPDGRWVDNRMTTIRNAIKQAIFNDFR